MFTSEAEGLIKSSVLTSGHQLPAPQLSKTDDFYIISLVDNVSIDSERQAAEQHSLTEESVLSDFEDSEETWTPLSPAVQTCSDGHNTDQVAKKYLIKIREENKLSQRCTRQIAYVTELYIRESLHSLKRKIDECLTEAGLDVNGIEGYEDCFDNATPTFDTISSDITENPKEGNNNLSYVVNMQVFIFISCSLQCTVSKYADSILRR